MLALLPTRSGNAGGSKHGRRAVHIAVRYKAACHMQPDSNLGVSVHPHWLIGISPYRKGRLGCLKVCADVTGRKEGRQLVSLHLEQLHDWFSLGSVMPALFTTREPKFAPQTAQFVFHGG